MIDFQPAAKPAPSIRPADPENSVARMADEVLDQLGGLDPDGRRLPGIKVSIRRGQGKTGGYTIEVTGPAPSRILLPGSGQ